MVSIEELLKIMAERKASDLHITAGSPPVLRIDGILVPTEYEKLTVEMCQKLIYSILDEKQRKKFEETSELDCSFGVKGIGRIRMNVYRQRGAIGAALRAIPSTFYTFEELGLPAIVYEVVKKTKGLVLVTGPTGSGKSTTLASMINYINENRACHIVTIEDPIEYSHSHKKSIINQREVGSDTYSFAEALKHVLRQDPDVILIGEMRDFETIQAALTIAETGHLVFATLHTPDAPSSINRIIDVFPPHQQSQVRTQLSMTLQAVFSQLLLPKAQGFGRVLACEVLIATAAVRNLIREGKVEQLYNQMQTGSKFGMQTFNQALYELVLKKQILLETALEVSPDPEEFRKMISKPVSV
ncbi:MAG: type IV pilus twitching motility protein PilT [bacterium]|nr:type IV pilus twitching motility protein PilT [bacterium]